MKFDTINGQSGSSVVSPSSDSGVHSLDEQWECMSTYSGESDSIQSVKTVYGDVACQADSPIVQLGNMDTRGVVFSHKGTYGKHDSMSYLSTNGHNSDIAAMSDFSDEEDEPREEVGPYEDVQPNIINSCEHSVLHTTPTEVTHHVMDLHDEDYWSNFRLLARQAFKLDDVKLAASDYMDAVKELVFRSRLTIMDIHGRADVRLEELHESDDDGDSDLSDYYCRHKLEDYRDWHYNSSPIMDGRATDQAYKSVGNADNAEGHDLTLEMEIEDKLDVCSEPDARAKFELSPTIEDKIDVCSEPDARAKFDLSPTKHVVALDKIGVNCITDGDVTVIIGNVAGDSDAHEDEYIRVSMISVDETRRGTSEHIHNSLGIRDCVIPECETQPTLVAYRDSALCNKESLQIMTKYCFGLCGSTNQFHSTDFEWCVECVDKLIWGFLVSCVVSIVTKNRSVGTDVFIKGSDVFVSIWGLLDGLIAPCDAMHECWWRTDYLKDTLNNVMLGRGAKMISHDVPGGEDNGQVLPITKEVQSQEEGCDNQPNIRRLEEGDGTTLMTGGGPDAGPGTMSGPWEGPFDADTTPMDTEDSPLINASMSGCPFRMTSYTGPATMDADTRYGLQLHHPRFLEFIGAPESASLLNQTPSFWVDRLGRESAMAAAVNLQRDAGFMMTNLQILGQFVMSLHRMSAEMLSIGVDHVVFPVDAVDRLSVMPRAQRAAKYMSAMGLWRPLSGAATPGPLPVSTCTSCMQCESCFGRRGPSAQ